jgi:shikimate kinase
MRIYLTGYMASGKSNLGRLVAEKLGFSFIDLDDMFEARFRISVLDFFDRYDEDAFRRIERSLLDETTRMVQTVISTGGGTPCFYDNMDVIKRAGISIYLRWPVTALTERLKVVKRKRPLLRDLSSAELEEKVKLQLSQREIYYKQADIVIDGQELDPGSLLLLITEKMKRVTS